MARRKAKTVNQIALEKEKDFLEKYILKASKKLEVVLAELEVLESQRG